MISIFQPSLGNEELEAVKEVFDSNWIGKGPKTSEFENQLANKIGCSVDNVLTTNCCTEGVFQILDYLGIGKGDEVIIPSISFIGIGNAILSVGATPIFCDIDKHTLNVTSYDINQKISNKTKAVIILHYGGLPSDMETISRLCKQNNITLIEDNACSPFSKYKGQNTGTIGDFGVWSFDAMKILVAGDCGLIYCKNTKDKIELEKRCYLGLETPSGASNTIDKKWWEFDISSPSRRSIINDITAAIGLEQLKKVDKFIERRKEIACFYDQNLRILEWLKIPPTFSDGLESSYYMYWIQLEERDELAKYLRENDIYTTFRYYPLHWVEYYKNKCGEIGKLLNTEFAANKTLCLPLHQSLSDDDIKKVVETIKRFKDTK